MANHPSVCVIVQTCPAAGLVADIEAERLDQMQFGTGIGTHPNDVAGIGRDFRLEENNGKHVAGFRE